MTELLKEKKLTAQDFKIGLKAARLYEKVFKGRNLIDDMMSSTNLWEIVAISAKHVKSVADYEEFVDSDEYDDLSDRVGDIVTKLYDDLQPKKD
jgi:hypothetical protein|nr:MAG TPA: hypothetical protein [Caudoviricetes sp.]